MPIYYHNEFNREPYFSRNTLRLDKSKTAHDWEVLELKNNDIFTEAMI